MFTCIAVFGSMKGKKKGLPKQFIFVGDNIRPVNESAGDIIMFRCITVLCFCVSKHEKQSFCWRQHKNNMLNIG